jgi:putative ABC transport system permease protein
VGVEARTRLWLGRQEAIDLLFRAAEALSRYKLRTGLSVLGVVLGVAAVIAMTSVSEGARREALEQVEALGLDNLVARNRGVSFDTRGSTGLTVADARRIPALVPGTLAVSPLLERPVPVANGSRRITAPVLGVRSTYQTILRLDVARGRFISALDERSPQYVCVLGAGLARQLFGYDDPIHQFVWARDAYFEVVGTLSDRGTQSRAVGGLAWRDLNNALLVPLPALSGRSLDVSPEQSVDEIWVQIDNGGQVATIGNVLGHALQTLHGGHEDVDVVVPRELLAQRYRTQETFGVVIGSIAAVALLIGGIGIMNIMLTSVVERTHEIGIRRTVGATQRDVTKQFLTESLLMTLAGGVVGILIGVASALGITAYAGWATYVSPLSVVLGVAVSLTVGLVFGLYPAIKAAKLDPVDALRYE